MWKQKSTKFWQFIGFYLLWWKNLKIISSVPTKAFALEPIWTLYFKFEKVTGPNPKLSYYFPYIFFKNLWAKLAMCWASCAPYSLSRNTDHKLYSRVSATCEIPDLKVLHGHLSMKLSPSSFRMLDFQKHILHDHLPLV